MSDPSQPAFDQEILNAIRSDAPQITQAIKEAARSSRGNEAQFAMRCDLIFAEFAKRASLHWEPLGERSVAWLEGESKRPDFYVVPTALVDKWLRKRHKKWLKTPRKKGQRHHDNAMRRLPKVDKYGISNLKPYKENWSSLWQ